MKVLEREASATEWDVLYSQNHVPWRSRGLSRATYRLLRTYSTGRELLEVGCGCGDDARMLHDIGFSYTGMDISSAAICMAQRRCLDEIRFKEADVFQIREPTYDVVYDKGLFHGLAGVRRRCIFIRRIAGLLRHKGIWVTVCGSADHRRKDFPHGAIYLRDLIGPAERYFEVLAVNKALYGLADQEHDFCAWHAAFRRR